jgi:hypothetical protein
MHFSFFHAGMCGAKALRQLLCGQLFLSGIPAYFDFIRLTIMDTQILHRSGFDTHVPACFPVKYIKMTVLSGNLERAQFAGESQAIGY